MDSARPTTARLATDAETGRFLHRQRHSVHMSMAIAHFALGVLGTAVVCRLLARNFLRSPTVVFAGGLWALLPDAHWLFPGRGGAMQSLHRSQVADVFWFHHAVDAADPSNSRPMAGVIVLLAFVGLVAVELSSRW